MNSVYNLKNMISTESDQLIQNPTPDINSSFLYGNTSGSGNNLNETMCNKTINEVWSEINQQKNEIGSMDHNNNLQQSILGETTLDNFLAHAKAINNGNQENVHVIGDETQVPFIGVEPNLVMASQPEDWLPLQMQMQMPIPLQMQMPSIRIHQQHQDHHRRHHQNQQIIGLCPDFGVANSVYENKLMEIGYSEIPIRATTMSLSSTCSDSQGGAGGGSVGRKHKYSDEMMEKTIERRQKRMAKNRESAARSRAKKQVIKICHCGQS